MILNRLKKVSKEIELMLLCSTMEIDEQDLDRITNLSAQDIDWHFFKTIIIQNRVHLIVYKNLKLIKEYIPENLSSELKELTILTGARNLLFTFFLQNFVNIFNKHNIFILPFKGPALAEQLYNDIVFRSFSDLDILVDKNDALKAFKLLKEMGLTAQLDLSHSQFKKYISNEDHFSFYDSKNKITVELHWEISGLYLSNPLTLSKLRKHIIAGRVANTEIPYLSPEVLLVYLCIHGSKHGWEYLEQLCCVAELIKLNPDLDWEKIKKFSADWKCKRMVSLGLFLAAVLLKAPVPQAAYGLKSDVNIIKKLAAKVADNLFIKRKDKGISDRFSFFHIQIRDSFIDKTRYGFRLIFRPTDKEWLYYPVPSYLAFVHYALRPFRLLFFKLRERHA